MPVAWSNNIKNLFIIKIAKDPQMSNKLSLPYLGTPGYYVNKYMNICFAE